MIAPTASTPPTYAPPAHLLFGFVTPDGRRGGICSPERPYCPVVVADQRPHQLKLKDPIVTVGVGTCRTCGARVLGWKPSAEMMMFVEVHDQHVRQVAGPPMTMLELMVLLRITSPGVAEDLELRGTEEPS